MPKYLLPDGNTIVADSDFIAARYPDAVRLPDSDVVTARLITALAFRSRFTDAEKINIYTAAESSLPIKIWLDDLMSAQDQTIDLIDPRIVAGVNAMEYGGLIGAGRAAEILA